MKKVLTASHVKEIREGILMGRRNYANNCNAPFDVQLPAGRLRKKAYCRAWVRSLYGRHTFPPRASSTRRKVVTHGPTLTQRMKALDEGTLYTTFYDDFYAGHIVRKVL
jgi:hypothetical protein